MTLGRVKAVARRLRDELPGGRARMARNLLKNIHPQTFERHDEIWRWAERAADAGPPAIDDDHDLRDLLEGFRGRFASRRLRVLGHVPPGEVSPAGESLMSNLLTGMRHAGIETETLGWHDDVIDALERNPGLLLTSGHPTYLDRIDWEAVARHRTQHGLLVGLAAPSDEPDQREWVDDLLRWATNHPVDFFYNWTPPEYGHDHRYDRHRNAGYPVLTIEFGANPIEYRPVPGIERDLDYVFLGSFHGDKMDRYFTHFSSILKKHPGFLVGSGWGTGPPVTIPRPTHCFLYARGRVGLNLHIPKQFRGPLQLNERAYNLAAAGIPQLVDNPVLLTRRFSRDAFFIAEGPKEYEELFEMMLSDPEEASRRARIARREVLSRYTILHVIDAFLDQLDSHFART